LKFRATTRYAPSEVFVHQWTVRKIDQLLL